MESTEIFGRIKNTFLFEFGKMNERGFRDEIRLLGFEYLCQCLKKGMG